MNPRGTRRLASLVLYKAYAELRSESERTYVGFLWWVIEPVLSMFVYYLVFSAILDRGGLDYVQFLFVGLIPWRWFQTTILHGANTVINSRGLMQLVYLPKIVFPLASVVSDTFKFTLVFLLLMVFLGITGDELGVSLAALPLVLVVQLLLVTGASVLCAALTPFLPDIRIVLENLIRLLFFLSGVFYDLDMFSDRLGAFLRLNPMAVILESYRAILLLGEWPDMVPLVIFGALSGALLAGASRFMARFDYDYPKLRF